MQDIEIGEADSVTDPDLLMAILETRENLEEATTQEEVDSIRQTNKVETQATTEALTRAFDSGDTAQAKQLTVKLRYLNNVDGVCRDWQPGKRIELQH